ncbi:exodeoxyribonuclease [Methanocella paludicola SANAE]|uniref:Exodeoxyribonuclease n=1 Tax=Methanocella paludicola (strain DSM 17711 / JCM 13418 / NBRC 101707 / SANAE) TaxID=304371 RepID=D1YXM9_METPS|nr:exodeoxyribonuclease III [Methanocella paludicola]BAI61201.1 exodeoxyribonuclease [Methanocella paludicola SANAE]
MRMLCWNVNGLRAVLKKGFVDWLRREDADIVCIQETKAAAEQMPPEVTGIPGYHFYSTSPLEKKGYSGVALFTKEEPKSVSYGFGIEKYDIEGRTIIADYGKFVLLSIYFPNGKMSQERLDYKMGFYDAFLDYVDKLKAEGRKVVVCGDVNTAHTELDIARPKENSKKSGFLPMEREWMDKFEAHGFIDTFRVFEKAGGHYTYWDTFTKARERNVGWRIDYFYVSDNLKKNLKGAFIEPDVMGSDHCPVGIDLKI